MAVPRHGPRGVRHAGADCPSVTALRVLATVGGIALVAWALAVGHEDDGPAPRRGLERRRRAVHQPASRLFDRVCSPKRSFAFRDRVMAYYAPVVLLLLPVTWVTMVLLGYTGIYWGTGHRAAGGGTGHQRLVAVHAGLRPSRRHGPHRRVVHRGADRPGHRGARHLVPAVDLRRVQPPRSPGGDAGGPGRVAAEPGRAPHPLRPHRLAGPAGRGAVPVVGDVVRRDRGEPHEPERAQLPALTPSRAELDHGGRAACSTPRPSPTPLIDKPHDARADVLLRGGYLCLRRIADFFGIPYDPDPRPGRSHLRDPARSSTSCAWSSRRPGSR